MEDSVDDEAELKRSSTDGDTVDVLGVEELVGPSVPVVDELVAPSVPVVDELVKVSVIEELWEVSVDPGVD